MRNASYRPDVDGLRAIAVLAVLAFHLFPALVRGGFVGVDIFFVISGFVITRMILNEIASGEFTFSAFYLRRIRRLFPALLTVMASAFVAGWIILLPEEFVALGRYIAAGTGVAANILSYYEVGYFDAPAASKPLLHLWSLGVEEQFYMFFPALIFLFARRRAMATMAFILIVAASFILNVVMTKAAPSFAFYLPFTRLWEFAAGAALALWPPTQDTPQRLRNSLAWLGLLLLAAAIMFTPARRFPGWWALLAVGGTMLTIATGPQSLSGLYILSSRPLVFVGLISYPLYLWHWPLLIFANMIDKGRNPQAVAGIVVPLSFLLATATYLFIERPILRSSATKRWLPSISAAAIAVAVFAALTVRNNGFVSRFPAGMQDLLAFRYDVSKPFRLGTCFIEHVGEFATCTDEPNSQPNETILLWGDSHAAALYRGVKKQYGDRSRVLQLTSSGCPPLLEYTPKESPKCAETNAKVLDRIQHARPDRVMLAAFWHAYDWQSLGKTAAALKALGVKRIDIIGSPPLWREPLPKVIYEAIRNDPLHRLPDRLSGYQFQEITDVDRDMAVLAAKIGANYISLIDILCDQRGCLALTDGSASSLVVFDTAHLTVEGAEFVAARFPR